MKILLESERCTGCYACQIACMDAHFSAYDPEAISFRRPEPVYDAEKGFQKMICIGCKHCEKPLCMEACPTSALFRDQNGFVQIHQEACIRCEQCISACPDQVIFRGPTGKIQKCDGCTELLARGEEPACIRTCFLHAIQLK